MRGSVVRVRVWLLGSVAGLVSLGGFGVASAQAASIEWQQGLGLTRTARLTAQINPQGVDSTCQLQYLTAQTLESEGWSAASTVPCTPGDLGAGSAGTSANVELTGLSLDTDYAFRFLASSGSSTVTGATETFATFGIQEFSLAPLTHGAAYRQAGGHPDTLTTKIVINTSYLRNGEASGDAMLKDVNVALPPGMIGDPAAVPQCPQRLEEVMKCPPDSQIGTLILRLVGDARKQRSIKEEEAELPPSPLFNLTPPHGVVARFGTLVNAQASAFINAGVRAGSDYGVDANSLEITSFAQAKLVVVNVWGDPASPSHDPERVCPKAGVLTRYEKGCAYTGEAKPFLREPTSCVGPVSAAASIDSYQEPGIFIPASEELPETTGCEEVPFEPSIEARPTTSAADSPTGLNVTVKVPQNEEPKGIDSSDLKDATVVFPAGVAVNPSSADGLVGCPETGEEGVGFTGFKELNPAAEPGVQTAQFTPDAAKCPDASKLGTVTIHTPLLNHPLTGSLYLATPHTNPFGSLVAVYLTVFDSISGVVVKLPGKVSLDPKTGQITTTFEQNPQLPFESLEVKLFGANEAPEKSRARLTTPQTCGAYSATSTLTPWSGNAASTSASEAFNVTEQPGGGACVNSEGQAPNAPGFESGTASPIAGTYSPFVLKLSREDGFQRFHAVDVTLPPGMIAKVAGVQQCPQADIEAAEHRTGEGDGAVEMANPSCPTGSEVGAIHVGAGSGAPFFVTGHAYFAGPYNGAPFSLVIVTPAIAGPFDLGVVTVRAGIYIDPHTAQVTVKSDPFPTILDGIPLDIRTVNVEIGRANFTLNPTSCDVMSVTGQEMSTAGQTAGLNDRFQVGGCTNLPFHPTFAVSTSGKTSRKDGASLDVRIVEGQAGEANVAKVHVELPKQLPARNDTLKLACPDSVFAANPAACPEGSRVGTATAVTPILASPLTGPAYLVSHGGAAFPDMEIVLQGEGITIVLDGKTNIDGKTGITSSSFESVPDAPISSFDLSLPSGPHSILGAPEGVCSLTKTVTVKKKVTVKVKRHGHVVKKHGKVQKRRVTRKVKKRVALGLAMPTVIQAQNGAVITQKTPIHVAGCPVAALKAKAHKKRKSRKHTKGHAKSKKHARKK
jgi:hypothetical protein